MANFFGRRYMRGQPRPTERLVGAFVLGLLAVIVALFALTSGLFAGLVHRIPLLARTKDAIGISEKPLFVAETKNATPAAPPHEMREAMALLPQSFGDWNRTDVRVERLKGATGFSWNGAWSGAAVDAMRAVHIGEGNEYVAFRGAYKKGTSALQVTIVDAESPPTAFGLCLMSGKPAQIGQGGWVDEATHSGGFWAGRYCTDVFGSSDLDAASIDAVLRSLSSLQINYGRPFWAELVLPREGQTERSLRFIKKNALGLELSDCWLADYANGSTIGVMQPSVPAKVLAVLKQAAATRPAEAPHVQSEGLSAAQVAIKVGDRTLTAFDAGPYVFVISAPPADSEKVASTAKMLHDRWTGASAPAQNNATPGVPQVAGPGLQAAPASGAARFAEVDGLDAPTKIERYTDNLYEKIDGREPMFRSFGFAELRFGQYLDTRNKQAYDVYLYDMSEPNNALGIFMKERSNATASAGVGRDSYLSGPNVFFWKGKYYVNVLGPTDAGEVSVAVGKKIAGAIADSIADSAATFWAEEVLPKEERVPESFKYLASGALSYDFLQRVYQADYKSGEKTYRLFAKKTADAKAAHDLFVKIADASKKYGDEIEQRIDTPGGELLVSKSVDVYMIAFAKGVFVGGVTDCDDKALALQKAEFLRERMPADAAGEPEPASEPAKPESESGDGHGY